MTQPQLIERILKLLNIGEDVNAKPTPVIKPLLCKDIEGYKQKCDWNCRQAFGMLRYMKATPCPDISMAVHQTARFSVNPMLLHEQAGGWNKNQGNSADSMMSRTGYIIMYARCALIWCSKLQTEVALSTTETQYIHIALSQSLQEVIPIMLLFKEINAIFPLSIPTPEIHCKTWEDNNGCIALAKSQKFSLRIKQIAIKYHHFHISCFDLQP